MCGIAGWWSFDGRSGEELSRAVTAMADSLAHRGPDDQGVWTDPESGVALGFRRLSILDLSAAGAQPMRSASGRYSIVFNGEVYNHLRLREQLVNEGNAPHFRGHSDTETMLACIEAWGLRAAVERFIGMFAFALWDGSERSLTLVRDRAGVKPLYYAATRGGLLFGSELRALSTHADCPTGIDRGAAALYAELGYVPAPWSILEGVQKLRPGTMCSFQKDRGPVETVYWDARNVAEGASLFRGDFEEALQVMDGLLSDSVALRMIADVPVGLFLSGGVDSALVAACMQRVHGTPIRTFTVGFEQPDLDESHAAAAIAAHLGTAHTNFRLSAAEAIALVPSLAAMYDEPFADTSAIATALVARNARPHVTVALSGDGGDELFGGYHRHFLGRRMWERAAIPRWMRAPASLSAAAVASVSSGARRERMRRYALALRGDVAGLHRLEVGQRDLPVREAPSRRFALDDPELHAALRDPTELQMFLDFISYLPDDILVKVDRATMAVSLEAREPLLDHRIIEFAWSLPPQWKAAGEGKRFLRRLLARHVPDSLIDRGKRGFGVVVDDWLRGPLREWAESLLPGDGSFFDADAIRRLWRRHLAGESSPVVWRVLMFEAWRRANHRGA